MRSYVGQHMEQTDPALRLFPIFLFSLRLNIGFPRPHLCKLPPHSDVTEPQLTN